MESIINIKKRRRKFLVSPRLNKNMPKAWAYKEFEIGGELGLFSSQTGDFDIQKKHINNKGILVVSSGEQNNGIIGKTDVDAKIINENTITVDMFGNVFFRDHKYRMVTHARVFSLEFKNRKISKEVGLYFVAQMKYFNKKFAYDNMASFEKIKNIKISLPITENGDIDFEFMETYISEFERERISELDAYLEATGLNNTILSEDEKQIKSFYCNKTFKQYKIGELFEKVNLRFLKDKFDKSKDISKERTQEFNLPLVNAKDGNNGIMYYGREEDFESTELSIDIVNDGAVSTGNVYPQPEKTGVLYNAYLIKFKNHIPNENTLIFCSTIIEKSIKRKFGYDNKAGWSKVSNEFISLPITENGDIDFEFMEKYIRAIEKKVIKSVIDWKDKVISTTKEVVAFSDKDNRCIGL